MVEKKFDVRYFGPFPIVGKLSTVLYKINLLELMNCHDEFHVSQLKKYVEERKIITTPLGDVDRTEKDKEIVAENNEIILDSAELLPVKKVEVILLSQEKQKYYNSFTSTEVQVVASLDNSDEKTVRDSEEKREEQSNTEGGNYSCTKKTGTNRRPARFQRKKCKLNEAE